MNSPTRAVIEHYLNDELRHYQESEEPQDHIYLKLIEMESEAKKQERILSTFKLLYSFIEDNTPEKDKPLIMHEAKQLIGDNWKEPTPEIYKCWSCSLESKAEEMENFCPHCLQSK